jgi:hypothetical protein
VLIVVLIGKICLNGVKRRHICVNCVAPREVRRAPPSEKVVSRWVLGDPKAINVRLVCGESFGGKSVYFLLFFGRTDHFSTVFAHFEHVPVKFSRVRVAHRNQRRKLPLISP